MSFEKEMIYFLHSFGKCDIEVSEVSATAEPKTNEVWCWIKQTKSKELRRTERERSLTMRGKAWV